ncbi:MAG TPA: cystathionine beta-lyase [Sphingobium sp.]
MTRNWRSLLAKDVNAVPTGFTSLVAPVVRGSTTLFKSAGDAVEHWDARERPYSYGLHGTPTTLELAERISLLEGSFGTFLTPSGQAAIAAICLAMLNAGDHVLLPDSAYGPSKAFVSEVLGRFNVEFSLYPPLADADIAAYFRPNTKLIWCESPGSVTMEIQDVPSIVRLAHERNIIVALDNTYAAGVLFDAFAAGVDLSMQALTKYVSGHSDVFLASLSVANDSLYQQIGRTLARFGMAVSPDDCSLALRGMQTLAVRLDAIERSALTVARFLADRPEVERVWHPALPECPGHASWLRDFSGSSGVFSILLRPDIPGAAVLGFVDKLSLFKTGFSWGGVTSLAIPYLTLRRSEDRDNKNIVRLHVGLEPVDDLIEDLAQALTTLS